MAARTPPRRVDALSVVAGLVLLIGSFQAFAGAVSVGVTWDEPTHVSRTTALYDVGWYMPPFRLEDGEPHGASEFVYGPTFSLVGHALNRVLGNEPPGEGMHTAEAYAVRHLTLAGLGVLTALAVGVIGWVLSGSRRLGLWGAAALVAIPGWTGYAMFNIKDLPAAAGYTLVTLGVVLALAPDRHGPSARARVWLVPSAVAAGVFLGFGTRLAFWAPLAASIGGFLVLWVLQRRAGRRPPVAGPVGVVAGAVVGTLGIAATYPKVFATPMRLLVESVSGSVGFGWSGVTLTAGRLLPAQELPWWYLPGWLAATVPVLLFLLALLGAVVVVRGVVVRQHDTDPWWAPPAERSAALLVLLQATLLPAVALVTSAAMYDGLRQHLYMIPAVAVLAMLGAAAASARADRTEAAAWIRRGVPALLAVALLVPTIEQSLLFPYNYTYINPVAGAGGVTDRWETDYWKASAREAVTRVPTDVEMACSGLEVPRHDREASRRRCRQDVTTYEHLRGTDVTEPAPDGLWVIGIKRENNRPPAGCERVDDVTRWLRGERVVMTFVLVCEPDAL